MFPLDRPPHTTALTQRVSIGVVALALALGGCSFKKMAADVVGDALSGDGTAFASDEDPDLIREALPFGLKTYESLLKTTPRHEGLLLAAAQGFTAYAYMLQQDSDRIEDGDLAGARALRDRARKLFLRGRDYALRGLEVRHAGLAARLAKGEGLAVTTRDDVPYLYWAGAGWAGALGARKDDLALLADLPFAARLVERAEALEPGFDFGAAQEFLISYEGSRPGGSAARARAHYRKAVAEAAGRRAGVHLALAEAVSLPAQDLKEFRALLAKTLAYDTDRYPAYRLANVLAQRRARWLSTRIPDLFLGAETAETKK